MKRALLAGAALALAVLAPACSDDGDATSFCDRLADTDQLGTILGRLDSSDPAGVEEQLEEALEQFRALEGDAPGEIRDDVGRLRQGMAAILEAVEDNPDDPAAARDAITSSLGELSGLAQAGEAVVTYARDECGLDLGGEAEVPATGGADDGTATTTEG